jgi:hypothetical protein
MTESTDLKFRTAGDYMRDQLAVLPYYINESGLKIDSNTGELWQESAQPCNSQLHAP